MNGIGEKISIIVPVYNVESYLSKCMESILDQTYSNIQIIVIDDGSTDNSGNICDAYSKLDNRVEVYHTENNGLVTARKLGLEVSTGDYIGFVDADDYIGTSMFSELLDNIKESNADFVHFGFIEESSEGSVAVYDYYDAVFEMQNKSERIDFLFKYALEQVKISPSIWSKLYRADFIKKIYKYVPDKQQYGEDMICLCISILEAKRISLSKKKLYHHVFRKNSLSHLDSGEYLINEIKLLNCVLSVLDKYGYSNKKKENIFSFVKKRLLYLIEHVSEQEIRIPRYYFKGLKQIYGKNIIIYGAGKVGQDYYAQISQFSKCKILAWVDMQWSKYNFEYSRVVSIEKIRDIEFDMIIIAISDKKIRQEIKSKLICGGYSENKIYWKEPGIYF